MTTLIIDADYIKFAIASVAEKRTIKVTHKTSGKVKEFDNRTEFWGGWRKKDGGWLAEANSSRSKKWLPEDFDLEDVQTVVEPIENVLHSAKLMVEGVRKTLEADEVNLVIGRGDSFRLELSTILKYKGNRDGTLRPLLLREVEEFLIKKYKAKVVTYKEADDQCVIDCYGKDDHILVGLDKDHFGSPVKHYNPNHPEWGIVDCHSLGELRLDEKGDVRGNGRLFMYWQILSSDDSDNYAANSASEIKWAGKSAYKALVDCYTDREAFQAMSECYRKLYPEKKIITGWRGNEFEIDWKYVLNENFQLAKMWRWDNDYVDVYTLLKDFGCLTRDEIKEMK